MTTRSKRSGTATTSLLRSRFLHSQTLIESLADVSGLGPNSQVPAGNLNADVVTTRPAGNVIAEVVLVGKVCADLIEHRRNGFSLRNIKRAAGAEIGE